MERTVFDKFWFEKHQRKLLWVANSWIGKKYIFRFGKRGHNVKNRIVKITPNSVAEFISTNGEVVELKEHFFIRNFYAQRLYYYLYPMWAVMHIWDWFVADHFQLAPQLSFGFSTLTVYPGSLGSNQPDDGAVGENTGTTSWSGIIGATGNTIQHSAGGASFVNIVAITGSYRNNNRGIYSFVTSSLTSGATISAATLSLTGDSKADSPGNAPDVNIYAATPGDPNALVAADYSQCGSTAFSTAVTYSAFATGFGNNDFILNSSGIANINKTGTSSFSSRNANYDVSGVTPANDTNTSRMTIYSAHGAGGGAGSPTLVVTYTVVTSTAMLSFF